MKSKSIALLLAIGLLLGGCNWRQPIKTPAATPSAVSTTTPEATASPFATAQAAIPKLPERFGDTAADKLSLKVYDIKTKKTKEANIEEYLYRVLAGEMRQDWPLEALKAQAIIARTFLMDFLGENKASSVEPSADISTDPKESQAYDESGINDNIKKAVDDTRGMVIAYDGKFIKAWFHSASGGKTADAVEGLNYKDGNPPYIISVDSDESQAPKEFGEWENSFTLNEVKAGLDKAGISIDGSITEIKLGETGPSGRAKTFKINDKDVSAPELRVAMDPTKFRSTWITDLQFDGKKLSLKGKGFGHGVGMPQWGAFTMASNGKTAQEIIMAYFKDVAIVNLLPGAK